jgi:hypothetical protein
MRLQFFSDCIGWPLPVEELNQMIRSSKDISRKTFLKHVDPESMRMTEEAIGYVRDPRQGLTMAGDVFVGYHRSTVRGCPAVYFVWSATEFVFTDLVCLGR